MERGGLFNSLPLNRGGGVIRGRVGLIEDLRYY